MIVSVHLPKTAGSSFALALDARFGESLLRDYSDFPLNTPVFERNRSALHASIDNAEKDFSGVECIHGHFLPLKYLLMATKREITFVTWVRNPVNRILSNYHYWRRDYVPETAGALRRRVVEDDWSMERFCLGPEFRNFYEQYLWGFLVENFSFIGVTEFYESDLRYFDQHYLSIRSGPMKVNAGHNNGAEYPIEPSFRQEIEKYH